MIHWGVVLVGLFFSFCFGFSIGMIWDKKDWKKFQKEEMEKNRVLEERDRGVWK